MKKTLLAAAATAVLSASAASAAVIDFTSVAHLDEIDGAGGSYTATIAGFDISITTTDGNLNFAENQGSTGCQVEDVLACEKDGLGIGNDEITGGLTIADGQTLTLTFLGGPVRLEKLFFLDLFQNGENREQATVIVDGLLELVFQAADAPNAGGYLSSTDGLPVTATVLEFGALNLNAFKDDRDNDYALAGLEVSAVPVPAAGLLLIGGLGALGALRARRKS